MNYWDFINKETAIFSFTKNLIHTETGCQNPYDSVKTSTSRQYSFVIVSESLDSIELQ